MTDRILHFTIGPVQEFVGQARRVRDLWAGSFLLSWLTGHAMKAIEANGGEVLFPVAKKDRLLLSLTGVSDGDTPRIGSLPNRFKAQVPDRSIAKIAADEVHRAWKKLGDGVYETFIQPIADCGKGGEQRTKGIWDRQVGGFWDIAWVVGPNDGRDGQWLERRKHWRTHLPPEEPGDHCMLMGNWQEVSGFIRSRKEEAVGQAAFWSALRDRIAQLDGVDETLELREGERLCAIALIKRLFPALPEDRLGECGIRWTHGEDSTEIRRWPSTSYMAAVPWLLQGWNKSADACRAYAATVRSASPMHAFAERAIRLASLDNEGAAAKTFFSLDGSVFFQDSLKNEKVVVVRNDEHGNTRKELIAGLKSLQKSVGGESSPYYALLLMDGDRVGELLGTMGEAPVSDALSDFSAKVERIVSQHDGVAIYAGGDDVLALLTMPRAFACARQLQSEYDRAFAGRGTISAGIIFAEYSVPLRQVLESAHDAVDGIAKAGNGRNSIAVVVLKPSGSTIRWATAWDGPGLQALDNAVRAFGLEAAFSSKFFYNLRERYAAVLGPSNTMPTETDGDRLLAEKILVAEYRKNIDRKETPIADIERNVAELLAACRRHYHEEGESECRTDFGRIHFDGAMLVRFLGQQAKARR